MLKGAVGVLVATTWRLHDAVETDKFGDEGTHVRFSFVINAQTNRTEIDSQPVFLTNSPVSESGGSPGHPGSKTEGVEPHASRHQIEDRARSRRAATSRCGNAPPSHLP